MNTIRPLALVTGASSGLGVEFSLALAGRGYDLLLTGRDSRRLEETAVLVRAQGARAECKALDLGTAAGLAGVIGWVGPRPLEVLINNAGFGLSGPLGEQDAEALASMIFLNVTAPTQLTRAFLPGMIARGQGRILNVASTAAFQPCPGMAAYGATKAYLLSFSEAVAEESHGTGVFVTALCPGPTATGFADRASMSSSPLFKGAMGAAATARIGIRALLAGRPVRVAGLRNRLMAFAVRLAPRRVTIKLAKAMMRRNA